MKKALFGSTPNTTGIEIVRTTCTDTVFVSDVANTKIEMAKP